MKTISCSTIAILAALSSFNACAFEMQTAEVTYAAAPRISVYNDGKNTYIQAIPGLVVQGATADGDRLIVPGVPRQIHGAIGGRPIVINQYPDARQTATASPKADPAPAPATPAKTDSIASRLDQLEKDLQKKEQAYLAANANKGGNAAAANSEKQKPVEPVKPAPPEQVWEIRKSDGTLYGALSRWAATAKPKRQLIYATEGNDFPADPEASFSGDFDSVIGQVMESMKNSRFPLRACFWDNKPNPVVKIIHKNKRCED